MAQSALHWPAQAVVITIKLWKLERHPSPILKPGKYRVRVQLGGWWLPQSDFRTVSLLATSSNGRGKRTLSLPRKTSPSPSQCPRSHLRIPSLWGWRCQHPGGQHKQVSTWNEEGAWFAMQTPYVCPARHFPVESQFFCCETGNWDKVLNLG